MEIESLYKDGKPLHHLPNARQAWDENDRDQSSIFVVNYADWIQMDVKTVQNIFRHRHILVLNTSQRDEPFSLAELSKLGHLDRVVWMQGNCFQILFVNSY